MANEYLKRTPTSTGNRKVFTWTGWVKLNANNTTWLFTATPVKDNVTLFYINTNGLIHFFDRQGSDPSTEQIRWNPQFRDLSSWKHILINADTTQGEASERVKCYVNGVMLERDETGSLLNNSVNVNTPAQDQEFWRLNGSGYVHYFGARLDNSLETPNKNQFTDIFYVDGQQLGPEVFGFYKDGKGYISAGSTQATDFRNGQWVPRKPSNIIQEINDNGGFGVNGFYLPMNDSSNFGADFHCPPNSIIKLKGENLPQPRNGAPETTDAYVSQLRTDPYAANLVLAVPGISTSTSANLVTNGTFDSGTTGWTATNSAALSVDNGRLKVLNTAASYGRATQTVTGLTVGQRYTFQVDMIYGNASYITTLGGASGAINPGWQSADYVWRVSFTASTTSLDIIFQVDAVDTKYAFWDNVILKAEDAPRDYSADIKGSGTNKTLTANGNAGVGYELGGYYGSAMGFPGNSGDYVSTLSDSDFAFGTGDFTVECWVNPQNIATNTYHQYFDTRGNLSNSTTGFSLGYTVGNFYFYTNTFNIQTSVVLDQLSHIVVERQGSNLTLYKNGVVAGIQTNFGLNLTNSTIYLGATGTSDTGQYFKGQLQDVRVYKGVAKYKGGFDVPKPYTPVGIATWRAVPDTCQNNFATWNPLDVYQNAGAAGPATLSSGNLITGSDDNKSTHSNFGVTSGKWYYESMFSQGINNSDGLGVVAQYEKGYNGTSNGGYYILYRDNGGLFIGNGTSRYDPPAGTYRSWGPYDVISVGIDVDNREVIFFNKGIEELRYPFPSHVADGAVWMPALLNRQAGYIYTNFGQNPTFSGNTTAGTFADSNGKGLFKYQPPSGFLALCEDNLPTPAIPNPGEHFKTVLYTGDGLNGRSITGVGFKPDLVWIKSRNASGAHQLMDSVRGAGIQLYSNLTNAESAGLYQSSFDSDGFSINYNSSGATNNSGTTYTAWCWKAGGESVTNTDGSTTSQVSVNQDAGFSIVSTTGTNNTVGHGLGRAPAFIIAKDRLNAGSNWVVYHKSLGAGKYIILNSVAGSVTDIGVWGGVEPTSTVFRYGSYVSGTFIAYCWTEIEGFSKFGSYVGNASTDGPFVYCGFKPALVLIKSSSDISNWLVADSSRNSTNPIPNDIYWNLSDTEYTSSVSPDFVSNGFKMRTSNSTWNGSGRNYIFAAFAESPINYSNAK